MNRHGVFKSSDMIFTDYVEVMTSSSISSCILLMHIVKAQIKILFRIISITSKRLFLFYPLFIFHFTCIVRVIQMSKSKATVLSTKAAPFLAFILKS